MTALLKGRLIFLGGSAETSPLRTKEIDGVYVNPPREGEHFLFWGESLTEGGTVRVITTSEVELAEPSGNGYSFKTRNSFYRLEMLTDEVLN